MAYVATGYVGPGYIQEGISIDWLNKIIKVPVQFLTPVSAGLYSMDVNTFRLALKDLEDGEGIPFEDTHRHNTEVVLSGVTYARTVEIINGYTVEFEEDIGTYGYYTVLLTGANHNLSDVKVPNSVSIVTNNSAGLQTVQSPAAGPTATEIAMAVWADTSGTLVQKILRNKTVTDPVAGTITVYDDDGVTPYLVAPLYQDVAGSTPYQGNGADRRDRLT